MAPTGFPLSSQLSSTAKPRTSRYQGSVLARSLTVRLGATLRSCRPLGLRVRPPPLAGRELARGTGFFRVAALRVLLVLGAAFLRVGMSTLLNRISAPPSSITPPARIAEARQAPRRQATVSAL